MFSESISSRYLYLKFLFVFALCLALLLIITNNKAFAITENTANIADYFLPVNQANFAFCNRDHAQTGWISADGNSTSGQVFNIGLTQDSIALQYNSAAAVCGQNIDGAGNIIRKNLLYTYAVFSGTPSTNVPGLTATGIVNNTSQTLDYGCANLANMRYIKECYGGFAYADPNTVPVHTPFTLSGLTSLPSGTTNVTLLASARYINRFSGPNAFDPNDDVYQCVGGREQYVPNLFSGIAGPDPCQITDANATLTVVKPSSASYDVGVSGTCDVNAGRVVFDVTHTGTVTNNVTIERRITLSNPSSTVLPLTTQTFSPADIMSGAADSTHTFSAAVGQVLDADIRITSGGGAGAANNASNDQWIDCGGSTETRVARPYLRVYGGDTITGMPFSESDGSCVDPKNSTASIETYSVTNSSGSWVGSGSQFAASAAASIEGFVSASMHNGAGGGSEIPKPTNDLSFGNFGSGGRIASGQPSGNDTKAYTGCIPDYVGYARTRAIQQTSRSLSSSDAVGPVLWVKGDLRITGNRIFTMPAGGFDKIEDFQSFRYPLVVVEGNINIDPGVSQLTGLYVAVPDVARPGSGVVNTCNNSVSGSPLSACLNKLTIKGALVANQVKFNRLNGDIVTAPSNEAYTSPNIAESIYFPPEMYLMYASDYTVDGFTIKGKYQSVVGLPPIL